MTIEVRPIPEPIAHAIWDAMVRWGIGVESDRRAFLAEVARQGTRRFSFRFAGGDEVEFDLGGGMWRVLSNYHDPRVLARLNYDLDEIRIDEGDLTDAFEAMEEAEGIR